MWNYTGMQMQNTANMGMYGAQMTAMPQQQPYYNYNVSNIYNNFFGGMQQPMQQQQPYYNYNISNIYNNFFGGMQQPMQQQPMMQQNAMPMMQGQMFGGMQQPMMQQNAMPMMQGQMFGGMQGMQSMPGMFQGQILGNNGMPMFQGQMFGGMPQQQPQQQPNIMNFLQLLMGLLSGLKKPMLDQTKVDVEAKAWGDPHFNVTNSDGKQLTTDHKGKNNDTYNILDARGNDGILIDAKYVEAPDPNNPQVMGKIRTMVGNEELTIDKDGNATFNGEKIEKGKTYKAKDGAEIKYLENGNIDIVSREKDSTVHIYCHKGSHLDVGVEGKLGNGHKELGGVLGTLLNHKDDLAHVSGREDRMDDIDGDGKSDDLNGNNFIDDNEWAKLGYDFNVTDTRAIA